MIDRNPGIFCPPAGSAFVEVHGRNISALLNPRPVVLIGSYKNRANFATVAWVTPLSHDPPLVAFALRPASKTLQDVVDTGCFSVSTLDASLLDTARLCGSRSGHTFDKGEQVAHSLEPHMPYRKPPASPTGRPADGRAADPATGLAEGIADAPCFKAPSPAARIPFVEGALSILDCEVESVRASGDHSLVIGYVCRALTRCAADEDGAVFATDTLLCTQHHHYTLGDPHCLESRKTADKGYRPTGKPQNYPRAHQ